MSKSRLTHEQAAVMSESLERMMRGLAEQIDFALNTLGVHETFGMTEYEWLDSIGVVGRELALDDRLYS